MQKLLAVFLWFASALAIAGSSPPKEPPRLLSEQEAKIPQFVVQWLGSTGPKANQKDAKWFYPSPHALLEYAESDLKMLSRSGQAK